MQTEELIRLLAHQNPPTQPLAAGTRLSIALASGLLLATLLLLGSLGLNPALSVFITRPDFWLKVTFVATLALLGSLMLAPLLRPGSGLRSTGKLWPLLLGSIALMWLIAAVTLIANPTDMARSILGETKLACLIVISVLSVPIFGSLVVAAKAFAPTHLRLAGAAIGFSAGAWAALVYCLHCAELAAPFVALWYLLGILIPTGIGWLVGERLLRW